jgi:excisionase family DNA binding protein
VTESRLPILFSVEEVADILHIGRSTVFNLIKQGKIQSIKLGRSRRVPIDAMQTYVDELVSEANDMWSKSTEVS